MTVEQLAALGILPFEANYDQQPVRAATQLREMLGKLRNRRLVSVQWHEDPDLFGESSVEILPTLVQTIPFENADAWQQQVDLYQSPAAETEAGKDSTP